MRALLIAFTRCVMKEEWRGVVGYEGLYQVSNMGKVRRIYKKCKRELNPSPRKRDGYVYVALYRDGKPRPYKVHRLVAQAFISGFREDLVINHKDFNPSNNTIGNLECVDQHENMRHYWSNKAVRGYCKSGSRKNPYKVIFETFGVVINIGYFKTAKIAQEKYREAYLNWYGKEPKLLPIKD